jgi:Mrp family chromosome partitioning ATPase
MAVADAYMLAGFADHVLFVASADQTRRSAAKLAVDQLRRSHARLIGVVLNRVSIPRWTAFYSPYYSSEYDSYYTRGEQ